MPASQCRPVRRLIIEARRNASAQRRKYGQRISALEKHNGGDERYFSATIPTTLGHSAAVAKTKRTKGGIFISGFVHYATTMARNSKGTDVLPVFRNTKKEFSSSNHLSMAENETDHQNMHDQTNDEDFNELIIYTTQRGHESCRYRGYAYRISSMTSEMKRWRCRREGCKGKLWTTSTNAEPEERDTHSHLPFDYGRKQQRVDDGYDGQLTDEQIAESHFSMTNSNLTSSSHQRKRNSTTVRLPNDDELAYADSTSLQLLASTFQVNLDQDDLNGINANDGVDDAEYNLADPAVNLIGAYDMDHHLGQNNIDSSFPSNCKRTSSAKRKRVENGAVSLSKQQQQQQQDLIEKAEFILALMGTRATSDGQRLELFLGDMVEKLASMKDALDSDDHNRLRCVIGQFTEIPVLLNQTVDVYEKQRLQHKKRRMVADVLKRMLPGEKGMFRFEPEVASTSSLTSDEPDNSTPSW